MKKRSVVKAVIRETDGIAATLGKSRALLQSKQDDVVIPLPKGGRELPVRELPTKAEDVVVPLRRNASEVHVSTEINRLRGGLEESIRLLEEGRSVPDLGLPKIQLPKEMPLPPRIPKSKMCKIPSAGSRDSKRELKRAKKRVRKTRSFVRKLKR